MESQSDSATAAFAISLGVSGIMTLIFSFFAAWPRGSAASKTHIAIWAAFATLALAFVNGGLLVDLGGTIRNDHVEYNYARWIGYTIAYVLSSWVISGWQWFASLDGMKLASFAFATGTLTTLAGLGTDNRRWPVFAVAAVFGVMWVLWVFWKSRYNKPTRTTGSKFWTTLFSIVMSLMVLLNLFVFFFSRALLAKMSFLFEVWIYAGTVCIISVILIIPVLDYEPEIEEKRE